MRTLSTALVLLTVAITARAQDADQLRIILKETIDAIQATPVNSTDRANLITLLFRRNSFVAAAARTGELQNIIEANRIDKQVGSSGGSTGSTNLVSSGSVPRLLGLAMEHGALAQTTSGTTITFRTNPAGLVGALRSSKLAPAEPDTATQNTLNFLEKLNFGLTFDTSRENDKRFTGSYRQLQEASAAIYLYNRRDPRHRKWQPVWNDFRQKVSQTTGAGTRLANALNEYGAVLQNSGGFSALQAEYRTKLNESAADRIAPLIIEYLEKAGDIAANASQAGKVIELWDAYLQEQKTLYNEISRSPILTLEYVLARSPIESIPSSVLAPAASPDLPDLSVARLIFVRPFIGSSEMTLNASMGLFNTALPSMRGNIRDWQFGGKLDFRLPELAGQTKGQLTLSGLYVNLRQKPLGVPLQINGKPLADKGEIGLFQGRVRFPLGDSGFSIPISLTVASRTELIDETEVRGNIGFTFDMDKLLGRAIR